MSNGFFAASGGVPPLRDGRQPRRLRAGGLVACGLAAALALAAGCGNRQRAGEAKQAPLPEERDLGEKLVNVVFDQQIAAGVVADRTIYPHYFGGDGVTLNPLGRRQIDLLVEVATDQPITVNVPDTGVDEAVHEARVAAVRERLLEAGVSPDRLEIGDAPPGGPGISTELVIRALEDTQRDQLSSSNRSGGSGAQRPGGASSGSNSSGGGSSSGGR